MKYLLFALFSIFLLQTTQPQEVRSQSASAESRLQIDTIKFEGMVCDQCERRVTKSVRKIEGIETVEADHTHGLVVVEYDPTLVHQKNIERAIAKAGYKTPNFLANESARQSLPACCKEGK